MLICSPAIAKFMNDELHVETYSLRGLGLRDAEDFEIFRKAREHNVIFITKDGDFVDLLNRYGSPPKVLWLRVGNTRNDEVRRILQSIWSEAQALFDSGNQLVEITR